MRYNIKTERFLDEGGVRYLIEQLSEIIKKIEVGDVNLTDYVKKKELQAELDKLDINVDLTNYVTTDELAEALRDVTVDLSDYYTKTEVDEKIPSLDGYATESFVTNKIAEAELGGGDGGDIDLSGYATKDDLNSYALKTDIPNVRDGVDGQPGADGVDGFSPIATVTKSGDKVTISITDKSGTTTATVNDPDLSQYATKDYVDGLIPDGGDVEISVEKTLDVLVDVTDSVVNSKNVIEAQLPKLPTFEGGTKFHIANSWNDNAWYENQPMSIAIKNKDDYLILNDYQSNEPNKKYATIPDTSAGYLDDYIIHGIVDNSSSAEVSKNFSKNNGAWLIHTEDASNTQIKNSTPVAEDGLHCAVKYIEYNVSKASGKISFKLDTIYDSRLFCIKNGSFYEASKVLPNTLVIDVTNTNTLIVGFPSIHEEDTADNSIYYITNTADQKLTIDIWTTDLSEKLSSEVSHINFGASSKGNIPIKKYEKRIVDIQKNVFWDDANEDNPNNIVRGTAYRLDVRDIKGTIKLTFGYVGVDSHYAVYDGSRFIMNDYPYGKGYGVFTGTNLTAVKDGYTADYTFDISNVDYLYAWVATYEEINQFGKIEVKGDGGTFVNSELVNTYLWDKNVDKSVESSSHAIYYTGAKTTSTSTYDEMYNRDSAPYYWDRPSSTTGLSTMGGTYKKFDTSNITGELIFACTLWLDKTGTFGGNGSAGGERIAIYSSDGNIEVIKPTYRENKIVGSSEFETFKRTIDVTNLDWIIIWCTKIAYYSQALYYKPYYVTLDDGEEIVVNDIYFNDKTFATNDILRYSSEPIFEYEKYTYTTQLGDFIQTEIYNKTESDLKFATKKQLADAINNLDANIDHSKYATQEDLTYKSDLNHIHNVSDIVGLENSVSPQAEVVQDDDGATIIITDINGTTTATIKNGKDGEKGDAFTFDDFTLEQLESLKGTDGQKGDVGEKGEDGYSPIRGVDYWTTDDVNEIHSYINTQLGVIENGSY